jgi:putative glutamine amidotransferase
VTSNHGSFWIKKLFLGSGGRTFKGELMTPVIGITSYDDQAEWRKWKARAALLPYSYVNAVRQAGGRPVLLPPGGDSDEAAATVAGLDGLVISGGPDVDPARYGQARHPRTQPSVPVRDDWDLAVTGAALTAGVPLLAICRGMQVLNVCRGGTLHQHVPDLVGHESHEGTPGIYGRHQVRVSPDSMLAGILPEPGMLEVPTYHHQAVNLVGDGLRAVAWHADGTVEAVEAGPSELDGLSGFVLGVQWHPEQGEDVRLFGALVSAAIERAAARTAVLAPMI